VTISYKVCSSLVHDATTKRATTFLCRKVFVSVAGRKKRSLLIAVHHPGLHTIASAAENTQNYINQYSSVKFVNSEKITIFLAQK